MVFSFKFSFYICSSRKELSSLLASNPLDSFSAGNRAYCYSELAVSSLAVAETIASTIAPTRGGMVGLSTRGRLC